jgi:hypothetical protein
MDIVYTADPTVYDPDVGARVRAVLDAERLVLLRTVSGSALVITRDGDGDMVSVRHSITAAARFESDGVPLVQGRIEATSCCVWSAAGYTSSRPVVIAALEGDATGPGIQAVTDRWKETLRGLAALDPQDPLGWLRVPQAGHPEEVCPGAHCALKMAPPLPLPLPQPIDGGLGAGAPVEYSDAAAFERDVRATVTHVAEAAARAAVDDAADAAARRQEWLSLSEACAKLDPDIDEVIAAMLTPHQEVVGEPDQQPEPSFEEQTQMALGRLVCTCCGYSKHFETGEDAFREGWDAPPHFTQFVLCDRCPSVFVMLGKPHPGCAGPTRGAGDA